DGIRYRNVTGVQTCALPIYFHWGKLDTLLWLLRFTHFVILLSLRIVLQVGVALFANRSALQQSCLFVSVFVFKHMIVRNRELIRSEERGVGKASKATV